MSLERRWRVESVSCVCEEMEKEEEQEEEEKRMRMEVVVWFVGLFVFFIVFDFGLVRKDLDWCIGKSVEGDGYRLLRVSFCCDLFLTFVCFCFGGWGSGNWFRVWWLGSEGYEDRYGGDISGMMVKDDVQAATLLLLGLKSYAMRGVEREEDEMEVVVEREEEEEEEDEEGEEEEEEEGEGRGEGDAAKEMEEEYLSESESERRTAGLKLIELKGEGVREVEVETEVEAEVPLKRESSMVVVEENVTPTKKKRGDDASAAAAAEGKKKKARRKAGGGSREGGTGTTQKSSKSSTSSKSGAMGRGNGDFSSTSRLSIGPNTTVACKVKDVVSGDPQWILGTVVRYIPESKKYQVLDVGDTEDGNEEDGAPKMQRWGQTAISSSSKIHLETNIHRYSPRQHFFFLHTVAFLTVCSLHRLVFALAHILTNRFYKLARNKLRVLPPEPNMDLAVKARALAVYPNTTVFYPATVRIPARKHKDHEYLLEFDDEEDDADEDVNPNGQGSWKPVPAQYVLPYEDL